MRISQPSTLFTEFLHILNEAKERHGPYPLFQTLAATPATDDGTIPVAVYAGEPEVPVDHFRIRYRDGAFELVERGEGQRPPMWELPQAYLGQVVQEQDKYLNNPGHFDVLCMGIKHKGPIFRNQ